MGKYDELVGRLQRFSTQPIAHDAPAINRIAMDHAATAITTLEAELAAMRARGDRLAEAFLETREMLGLAEQAVCEECCPTTWKTADGRPHCKLHEDIRAVLFKHEATRDQALTEWRDQ